MKINTFIVLLLIFRGNYGFCSDKKGSDQSQTSSGYSSVSKDYMSGGKCTETKVRK